jgi:hypothetical protein
VRARTIPRPPRPASSHLDADLALKAAWAVVRNPDALSNGSWPRAAATLGRQAIERTITRFWENHPDPAVRAMARVRVYRTHFICLRFYLDPDLAGRVSYAWSELSNATHHHAYDLAPSATELSMWLEAAQDLLDHTETLS